MWMNFMSDCVCDRETERESGRGVKWDREMEREIEVGKENSLMHNI